MIILGVVLLLVGMLAPAVPLRWVGLGFIVLGVALNAGTQRRWY